jgi:glycosyltransferase involved in cell wall biosynthesis
MFAKRDIVARWQQEIQLPDHALTILPSLSDAELLEAYVRADAHCMPSTGEGFGIPVIEAARTSTPNILSPLPVFREIVGDDAVFTASFRAEDIADSILTCMSSDTHEMTMRGRLRSHNFLFDSIHERQAAPALQAIAELPSIRDGKVRE